MVRRTTVAVVEEFVLQARRAWTRLSIVVSYFRCLGFEKQLLGTFQLTPSSIAVTIVES